ncbi:MAG: hypothetical protein Q8S20_04350 [Sulfuritalea sp.]|nr:hypothetical protein [Sulfuritalea sp.]
MDTRTIIFYVSLLLIVGTVAELYVRIKGIGGNVEKLRGVVVPKRPMLGPPVLLLIAAVIVAVVTLPR